MARRTRMDFDGAWHHVMNRGVAHKEIFQSAEDRLESHVGLAVRRGEIEVHDYCLLSTHFHLLVRSRGRLSTALQRIESDYSRWFNRRNSRDGPLYRARFRSKFVDTLNYRRVLLRYIALNPVEAGLVRHPRDWLFCAAYGILRDDPPWWLSTSWLDEELAPELVTGASRAEAFEEVVIRPGLDRRAAWVVEHRFQENPRGLDPLDRLANLDLAGVSDWLRENAREDEGTCRRLSVTSPQAVAAVLDTAESDARLPSDIFRDDVSARDVATVGMLRDLCSLTFREISRLKGIPAATARSRHHLHQRGILTSDAYVAFVAESTWAAIAPMLYKSVRHF